MIVCKRCLAYPEQLQALVDSHEDGDMTAETGVFAALMREWLGPAQGGEPARQEAEEEEEEPAEE